MLPCYSPLKGFRVGTTRAGKPDYKVVPYSVDHIELRNGVWTAATTSMRSANAAQVNREFVQIPCGQCIGCRLQYSREWANRLMMELQYHKDAYFITLTYDDLHVPRTWYSDPDTGEAFQALTLVKKHVQDWMKRLRKRFPDAKIRYYLAGEYGDQTQRPHYHAIVYGLHLDDLVVYKRSPLGHVYYNSDSLQKTWSIYHPPKDGEDEWYEPLGYAVVAAVSWESCAYTARYVMKKMKGDDAQFYTDHNLQPPFTLMSRKPGIAAQYFADHPDIYDFEFIHLPTQNGGLKFKPPRYFDKLFDLEHHDELEEIKAIRKRMAEEATKARMFQTSLSYLEQLAVDEQYRANAIKKLERRLENGSEKDAPQ